MNHFSMFRLVRCRIIAQAKTFSLSPNAKFNHGSSSYSSGFTRRREASAYSTAMDSHSPKPADSGVTLAPNSRCSRNSCSYQPNQHATEMDSNLPECEATIADLAGPISSGPSQSFEAADEDRGCMNFRDRKILPEELSRNLVMLSCESSAEGGNCNVYLVGTRHRSKVVFLELCSSHANFPQNSKVGDELCEFLVAYNEAMAYGGKVVPGDRPMHITLKRMVAYTSMTPWHTMKFYLFTRFPKYFISKSALSVLEELAVDDFKLTPASQERIEAMFQEINKISPALAETLGGERDRYMSSTLLKVASQHSSVVAVVGASHLAGIKKHWKQPVEMEDLLQIPSQTLVFARVCLAAAKASFVAAAFVKAGILSIWK